MNKFFSHPIKNLTRSTFFVAICLFLALTLICSPSLVTAQSANPALRSQFEESFREVPYKVDLSKKIGLLVRNQNKEQESGGSHRLLSDLTKASFLKLSNYQATVIDLSELENIWEKSIEFNNANFETLFESSKFDVFAIVDYEPVTKGIQYSINFYNSDNTGQGNIIHSIPSQLLEIDWSSIEEVEILSAGEAKALNARVDLLLKQQEIVKNPTTFEEHFANYQIYETEGKTLEAITSLVNAIVLKPIFIDLITDVTRLTRSYFGAEASAYLENVLYPHLHPQLVDFSKLLLDPNYDIFSSCNLDTSRLNECQITVDEIIFPQLLNLFINTQGERYAADKKNWGVNEVRQYVLLQATRTVLEAYKDGSISDNYLNKLRSIADVNQSRLLDLEQKLNTASFIPIKIKSYVLGSGNSINVPKYQTSVNNGRLIHQFLPLKEPYGNIEGTRNEESATPLEFYNFTTNSFGGGDTNSVARNIGEVLKYLPPKFMAGGARDVLDFMDHRSLGPCGLSNGRHTRSSGDYKTYVTYFNSAEERSSFIKNQAPEISSDKRREAITYWNSLPLLEHLSDKGVPGLFRATYLSNANNYLPQNNGSSESVGKLHADRFITPENDRLMWADVCIVNMMRTLENGGLPKDDYIELRYSNDGLPVFNFSAIANLYITDSVDTSKPIYVSASNGQNSIGWARLDISSDGTYFDPNGVNLDISQFIRYVGYDVLHKNNWLYAPGIVQSSIGLNDIDEIKYTDIYGNIKRVKPNKSHTRSAWSQQGDAIIDRNDEYLQDLANLKTPKEYFLRHAKLNYSLFEAMGIKLPESLVPRDRFVDTLQNHQKPTWCSNAKSVVEKTICSNSELSELEIEFTTIYRNVKTDEKSKAQTLAKSSYQKRVKCGSDIECIKSNYVRVIADLSTLSRLENPPIDRSSNEDNGEANMLNQSKNNSGGDHIFNDAERIRVFGLLFERLEFDQKRVVQYILNQYGFYTGSIDGAWGPNTERGVALLIEQYESDTSIDARSVDQLVQMLVFYANKFQ